MKRVRVLLAEDGWAMARHLGAILAQDCELLATVSDGLALVRLAREMHPDVVVTDISMPGITGLEAVARLVHEMQDLGVVFITVHAEPAVVRHAMALAPCGYVLKADAGDDLLPAVHAAMQRQPYVSASLRVYRASQD